jgi:hypothetical protein
LEKIGVSFSRTVFRNSLIKTELAEIQFMAATTDWPAQLSEIPEKTTAIGSIFNMFFVLLSFLVNKPQLDC